MDNKEKIEKLFPIITPYIDMGELGREATTQEILSEIVGWCRLNENRLNAFVEDYIGLKPRPKLPRKLGRINFCVTCPEAKKDMEVIAETIDALIDRLKALEK